MLRVLDVLFAILGLLVGMPVLLIIALMGLLDTGSPLFFQTRVGRHQQPFKLVKFRTMKPNTASVATHLADPTAVTNLGQFLRRSKLDELPQLWNVLVGHMSLVGPRPCLFGQIELIDERARRHVFDHRPGITGLAQLHGIDMSTPSLLDQTDAHMLEQLNVVAYIKYILQTLAGRGAGDRITPQKRD